MDRRTVLAFALIGLLTFAWIWSIQNAQHKRALQAQQQAILDREKQAIQAEAPTTTLPPATAAAAATTVAPSVSSAPVATTAEALREDIRLNDPAYKYQIVWTNRGAGILEARLRDYAEQLHSTERELLLETPALSGQLSGAANAPAENQLGTLSLRDPKGLVPLDSVNYRVISEKPDRIAFEATFANGLNVVKEFLPTPEKNDLRVRVTLKNTSAAPLTAQYSIVAANRLMPDDGSMADFQAAYGLLNLNGGNISVKTKAPGNAPFTYNNNPDRMIAWAGVANRYFAAVLKPVPVEGSTAKTVLAVTAEKIPQLEESIGAFGGRSRADNVRVELAAQPRTLQPGEQISDEYIYFLGPKDQRVLVNYPEIAPILDYGWFGIFSRLLLGLLNGLHRLIPNYGVGIILLTIVVKLVLHPVTRKGQVAMYRMQRLQPLIKELQDKHKADRQRQGKEMMELYRKHGANPMSGCWPMALQIPILFGLFRMLQYSIDLRHASFLPVWITDLARPDTIGYVGSYPINILPVLMVISWVVQQWTMPKPNDPQQAQMQKMMMFMPVMMGFMFYGMASGLTLYWLTSTFLGILEQKYIKHHIKKLEGIGHFSALTAEAVPVKAQKLNQRPRK